MFKNKKLKNKTPLTNVSKIVAKPISPKTTSDLNLQQQPTSTKITIDNFPETPSNMYNSKQSFASTVANSLIPKKNISKERICTFISSKALVDNLIENHPPIHTRTTFQIT